jgi:hypothetical protein
MTYEGIRRRTRRVGRAAALAALLGLAAPATAQDGEPARDAAPKPVGLDALLQLPAATPTPSGAPEVGGATRKEWEERFASARADVQAAESHLAETQAELEKLASGEAWQVAAPGAAAANSETGPLSFGLRQEIRRSREEVERTRKALDELRIEANLAGVPADWIGEDGLAPAVP